MSSEKVCLIRKCWHKSQVLCVMSIVKEEEEKSHLESVRSANKTRHCWTSFLVNCSIFRAGKKVFSSSSPLLGEEKNNFCLKMDPLDETEKGTRMSIMCEAFCGTFLKTFSQNALTNGPNLYVLLGQSLYASSKTSSLDHWLPNISVVCLLSHKNIYRNDTYRPVRFQEQLLKIT